MNAELRDFLFGARHLVALTGAGVSTLSGIRDFRGRNGVYNEPWHGYRVEEILSIDCFEREPELFYEWAREFVYRLEDFEPSAAHLALAHLEAAGILKSLYTQNIDLLHTKAGSRRVFEVHGSPANHRCRRCGATRTYAEVAPLVRSGEVPRCPCGGVFKPDIVFYGENLDEALLERGWEEFRRADAALVMGSSLTVYPAAGLPEQTVRGGGKVVIVNAQPTSLDRHAALCFDDLAEFAAQVEEILSSAAEKR